MSGILLIDLVLIQKLDSAYHNYNTTMETGYKLIYVTVRLCRTRNARYGKMNINEYASGSYDILPSQGLTSMGC